MLKLVLPFLLITTALAQQPNLDERRSKILGIVDEELAEVTRLARQQDMKVPDTILRVSELNLEKARLYREAENERYIAVPAEKRREISRKEFFGQSTRFFVAANKAAELVVKRFPTYKGLGEVYYILAYNHKELGDHESAQKYFALAASKKGGNANVTLKSRLAQADYYFNDHKYKQAIPLYEGSINQINEKWWTKDSFNLAWCYYRTGKYVKALNLAKEVHQRSSNPKYIDMRASVERDIGLFFIDAGQMENAIAFYDQHGLNYTEQFVKIANTIISQGRFAQAEKLLDQAARKESDPGRKNEIYVAQLELLDKYNKIPEHLKVSTQLVKIHQQSPLLESQFKSLKYQVDKKAAELQKGSTSKLYANVPKVKQQKAREAIAYFELSAQLAPAEKGEKHFFQAETAYAASNYAKAVSYYMLAFDAAKANNQKKLLAQSMEGMLTALGQPDLDPAKAEKLYLPVYSRYLSVDNKSERANSISRKLFNTQYDKGDITGAEATMNQFAVNFPDDLKTQEGMLAKVMEHYRKKKDYVKVKSYVADINSGKYKVSAKYAEALRGLMTKIQIEGVQTSLEKGDKAVAVKGYHQIYDSSESTANAKANAAYNLSALYFEAGDSARSYQWGATAVKDMEAKDVNKFSDSFLSISSGLFLKQQFAQSSDLSQRVFAKLCKQAASNKAIAFKNSLFIALANSDLDKALEIRDQGKACAIPDNVIAEVSLEVLKDLSREKRWEAYEKIINELDATASNRPLLVRPMEDLRRQYVAVGNTEEASTIFAKQQRYFKEAREKKVDLPVEALDLMAERMLSGLVEKQAKLNQIQLNFPEADFNNAVKLKLQILDQLTNEVNIIQGIGSGKGIVEAYRIAIDSYEAFGESLRRFAPEGKSPEYVASFQKAMAEVYNPILINARKQRSEVKKLITDNKILSFGNYSVLYGSLDSFKRYITEKDAVLMDRGGRQ